MIFDLFNGLSGDPTMQGDKIYADLIVKAYHINKIFCCQSGKIPLIMNHRIIDWYCANHCRAFRC